MFCIAVQLTIIYIYQSSKKKSQVDTCHLQYYYNYCTGVNEKMLKCFVK